MNEHDKEIKLEKAIQRAKEAFWDEIDGDTDLPSGFGVEIKGLTKKRDEDTGKTRIATNSTQSHGQDLEKMLEKDKEDETNEE